MKKIICLFISFILLVGCSKIDDKSFEAIINNVLYKDTNLTNVSYDGYKLYLPRGTIVKDKINKNLEIMDNNKTYYLYVDTVSYFYKTKEEHNINNNIFYSKNLYFNDKYGYIDITKRDDIYFIEMVYNYAKVEAYIKENDLYDAFLNISYILTSIEYNDSTIKYNLEEEQLQTSKIEFDIFKSKKNNENFLQWVEKYDKYDDGNKVKDKDIIETEEID